MTPFSPNAIAASRINRESVIKNAVKRMKQLQGDTDTEGALCTADAILCDLLQALGAGEVVDEWHKVDKWYA